MSGGRCQRRSMTGRGAVGGCGTEAKPCPVSWPLPSRETAAAAASGLDPFAQARKALSYRSPFDAEEAGSRVPTLPFGLAAFLSKPKDGRRKHKKSHGECGDTPSGHGQPPTATNVWDQTEEYFRPVTLADIDALVPKLPFGSATLDSCLTIPVSRNVAEGVTRDDVLDAGAVEVSPRLEIEKKEAVEEEQGKEMQRAEQAAEEQALDVDEFGASGDTFSEKEEDDHSSLNWLLGSKERFVLTSERPNKKRKLLGGDAGLERLMILPHSQAEGTPICDFCCSGDSSVKSNQLLCCNTCKVWVHRKCYGVHKVPEGVWLCSRCKHVEAVGKVLKKDGDDPCLRPCLLCPKEEGGALKQVGRGSSSKASDSGVKFAHLFCSLWIPEVYVEDIGAMEPVMNIEGVQETRKKLVCNVCKVKHGACIRCSHGTCRTSFHPLCARESKHHMEIWGKSGCDNVELRAFCSKHSTSQDMSSVRHLNNVDDDSSVTKPLPAILPAIKIPKLRFTRKNRDKSLTQDEIASSSSDKMIKMEPNMEKDAFTGRLRYEGGRAEPNSDKDTDRNIESVDISVILNKLIDRGKINIDDIALEMGISTNSLQAALVGETTSFSPGLRLKIIKWLQSSVHMPAMRSVEIKSGFTIQSDNKVARLNGQSAARVAGSYIHGEDKVAGLDMPDAVFIKSLPPRRRTKSNIRILKDNKMLCSSGELPFMPENGNAKILDMMGEIPLAFGEDMKGDINGKKSSILAQKCCLTDQEISDMIVEDTFKPVDSCPPLDLLCGHEGNQVKMERNYLSDAHRENRNTVDGGESGISQVDESNVVLPNALEKSCWEHPYCDVDVKDFAKPDNKFDESFSVSHIHPFIKKKLLQAQNHVKQKITEATSFACPCYNQQSLSSTRTNMNHTSDVAILDELSKAKTMGILELSPEDEVEGEILYLQARLLDNAVAVKNSCDDLIFKVVQNLPKELDAVNRRKWDLILVNQFLREVREAKKRGRKERRHKEAQAVLVAAAAAAAASSRNSSVRKDASDEIISNNQESPINVSAVSRRAGLHSSLMLRTKDSSRSAVAKMSPDEHSGIFQIADFSKENALSCDICMRTETVLNRIFVCSSCKVAVHLDCYRRLKNPIGSWKCEVCEETSLQPTSPRNQTDGWDRFHVVTQCGLCGGATGAFRKSTDGQWVHAFCAEWLLESKFTRGQDNLVEGMDTISKGKDSCCICYRDIGACLKCSYGHCQITFHPSCARSAGFYMNVRTTGGRLQHKAYCEKHSVEQKEADIQHYGAEELKNIKQIRVELEKLRLLCERIIKREKLKRDLVLCSHDILASRRDYVAFSVLVQSSFFPPGVSSESATTSINNRSYSGTIQRSDEVTVDSTVSGKRTIRRSLHNRDIDRSTEDSSTSQLSTKRKLIDRASCVGKQLPNRSASMAFFNLEEDGEKKSRTRKHTETFQKELVMTSDQASMQNQRLPKGFAYVPIGCLSKERSVARDLESREPREPGG
ncbi:uncharacterized protein LOC103696693 isoform X2 [Phoenix dactylifera]|uniref:Uncharacterized protein LOC103696693 isoform X2 n=1 Tax=Phoenix dactylifera TaxID=42345 RepID=A0A8B7BH40_PHODC|nr:uncharacterized protein LOC103696693 isoform X2 [Phoenix dactylifera]